MDRRRFVIGTAATVLAAGPAFAQEAFPSHAITIITAFPPGGLNDIVTRPLATAMEPMDAVDCSSKIGFQLEPPSLDFQTPPDAVAV